MLESYGKEIREAESRDKKILLIIHLSCCQGGGIQRWSLRAREMNKDVNIEMKETTATSDVAVSSSAGT
jgi:hypothetical protein